jgi:hypothetical protein
VAAARTAATATAPEQAQDFVAATVVAVPYEQGSGVLRLCLVRDVMPDSAVQARTPRIIGFGVVEAPVAAVTLA